MLVEVILSGDQGQEAAVFRIFPPATLEKTERKEKKKGFLFLLDPINKPCTY